MSDQIALDLFIQDFVNSNKLANKHYDWDALSTRALFEGGSPKVFQFTSGGREHFAVGQRLILPDADWFRIELTREIPAVDEHRFDCLRMLYPRTHVDMRTDVTEGVVLVKLLTKHRGLLNLVFVVRNEGGVENPFLV
jgi:hypothetical protein